MKKRSKEVLADCALALVAHCPWVRDRDKG